MARRAELLLLIRALYGAALLALPRQALGGRRLGAQEPGAVVFARLLGARQLIEAAVLAWRPHRRVLLAGAAVDAAHGVSMLGVCALWPSHRRLAGASACVAAGLAASGVAAGLGEGS